MDRVEEAREALVDGLQFEPNDKVGPAVTIKQLIPFLVETIGTSANFAGAEHFSRGD